MPQSLQPGDWICSSCNDHQFARNSTCRRCGAPKAPAGGCGAEMAGYGGAGSYGGGYPPGGGAMGGGPPMGGGGAPPGGGRPGDWNCPACNDLQFGRNAACRRCGTPKPASGAYGGFGGGGCGGGYPAGGGGATMMSQPPPQGGRPGDWACPSCNDLVFAKNAACRRCGTPKPMEGGSAGSYDMGGYGGYEPPPVQDASFPSKASNNQLSKPGDWICSSCGDLQFARNASCRRCGAAPPAPPGAVAGGYGKGGSMGGDMVGGMGGCMGGGMGKGGPPSMRPGDWTCPSCADHVFAKNDACRRCGTPRPGGAPGGFGQAPPPRSSKMMPGDWNCPNCGDLQFARNSTCRLCSTPKPGADGGRDRSRSPIRG